MLKLLSQTRQLPVLVNNSTVALSDSSAVRQAASSKRSLMKRWCCSDEMAFFWLQSWAENERPGFNMPPVFRELFSHRA